jgi:hypothetical protein
LDGSDGINYYRMYGEVEAIVDYFGWTLDAAKRLGVRERRHWYKRAKAKKESISK